MGMYDTVWIVCPNCGEENSFQSKSGDCTLEEYSLEDCPNDVLLNVNRHSPCECECGTLLSVDIENRKVIINQNKLNN